MARGNKQWVVLRDGVRVVEECETVQVNVNFPKPVYEMLMRKMHDEGLNSINNLIRAVALNYLETPYKKENAK